MKVDQECYSTENSAVILQFDRRLCIFKHFFLALASSLSFKFGYSNRGLGVKGFCAVSLIILGLHSPGERSRMLLLGSAGATHLAWGSLHRALLLLRGPLLLSPSTFSQVLLSALGAFPALHASPCFHSVLLHLLLRPSSSACPTSTISGWLAFTSLSVCIWKSNQNGLHEEDVGPLDV